jgi:NADH-quinone oxidoreductase subunit J
MGEALFFYLFSTVMIGGALLTVTVQNPARALLSLLLTLFALAVLFILLHAYFIAMIHLLVYAGAILVLFLFVIMLLGLKGIDTLFQFRLFPLVAAGICLAFLGEIVWILRASKFAPAQGVEAAQGTIEAVGRLLFTKYLVAFELTGFLLLVGIVGAVTLARRETSA